MNSSGSVEECNGTNHVDAASGANRWVRGPPSNQTYLLLRNASAAGSALDELLCEPLKRWSRRVVL